MYDPNDARHALGRESGTDWQMFGHYIWNNIGIGLRTLAGGLLAGVGALFVLIVNGISIGTVFGHLQQIGSGDPLWRFVCGHAPFELTAIVLAGGAGLRLGLRWRVRARRAHGCAWAWRSCCWWRPSSKPSGRRRNPSPPS
jgi:uncharacterized membrane protein SpoIIM required for sporulation